MAPDLGFSRRRLIWLGLGAGLLAGGLGAVARGLPSGAGSVRVSAFGTDGLALQRAIDSGAGEVIVDVVVTVAADITLRSGQLLRFAGGAIRVPPTARITRAVLVGTGATGTTVIEPAIDGVALVAALRFVDSTDITIKGGKLTGGGLMVESHDNSVDRRTRIAGTHIDLRGHRATALYLSCVRGVVATDVTCRGGLEGVGIYNGARQITVADTVSDHHVQDGFLAYAGQEIVFDRCRAHGNGQSGFATQREHAGAEVSAVRWIDCEAQGNVADGFDMRGASKRPWGVPTEFRLLRCSATANTRCGFYLVMAEGTRLDRCTGTRNRAQNLFVDQSDEVIVSGFRSRAGASSVSQGPNRTGILVYNSRAVTIDDAESTGQTPASQDFAIAFTGATPGGQIRGGRWARYRLAPIFAGPQVTIASAPAPRAVAK